MVIEGINKQLENKNISPELRKQLEKRKEILINSKEVLK